MKTDKYTKAVLTIIAAALIWLCLWGPGPKWGTPAHAEGSSSNIMAVNIAQVGGYRLNIPKDLTVFEWATSSRVLEGLPVQTGQPSHTIIYK
jgi:hypothetical protein